MFIFSIFNICWLSKDWGLGKKEQLKSDMHNKIVMEFQMNNWNAKCKVTDQLSCSPN